ncbi:membrane protein [Candidatus Thiomargarita nelsonii]|uniref:Membrane protein n=1 Tax=Candidatus Thiomargarita nelsonii TaxID=1003181 RepID=A0A176RSZ7_9GAMM|nr:membrane protein [Candidatus Thiomargarita nelsonii]
MRDEVHQIIDDMSRQLDDTSPHPAMIQHRVESLEENISDVWDKITSYFSDSDTDDVTTELVNNTGLNLTPDIVSHSDLFKDFIQPWWSTDMINNLSESEGYEGLDTYIDGVDGDGISVNTGLTVGAGSVGIATVGVGNVVGGAGVAAGSTTAVSVANTIVGAGATAVTTASTAASSIPIVGGTIASGITTTAGAAATAGAAIGSAAVAAAPIVLPALAIWGIWKLFEDD